jgi:hypothetical protein
MKRVVILFFLLCSLTICVSAQVSTKEVVKVTTDITGASTCVVGKIYYNATSLVNWERNAAGVCAKITSGGTPGDVAGPASSTDNAVARFDGAGGKTLQNSLVTIDDSGSVNIPSGQTYKINSVALAKGDIGLGNVDNTSDVNKPVSTAQQTALDLKQNTITFGTGVQTALGVNVGSAGAPVLNGGALGSPSSAGTIPAFTLGGTVAGGGNQLNNVVIGTSTPLAGSFTTLSSTGTFTPSQTNGIVGTTTNNNANAGSVGEYVTASAAGVSITTATSKSLTSISLTAGDWDVTGIVYFLPASTTSITELVTAINTTDNTVDATSGKYLDDLRAAYVPGASSVITQALPAVRLSLSATTTVYLVGRAVFTVSTMSSNAFISARRVR